MLSGSLAALNSRRIILASGSPRRKELLQGLGLHIEVIPSQFAENLDKTKFEHPSKYVAETAYRKAVDVHDLIISKRGEKYDILISADTIVVLDAQIIEKPSDPTHAHQMLRNLSGRSHQVFTAVTILTPGANGEHVAHNIVEETQVQFGDLSDVQIASYVATGAPLDKAGGYGIQDPACGSFIAGIKGCYYNVVGFPLHSFSKLLLKVIA